MDGLGRRIATLDALRGVAVMGILLMNIVSFAMPEAAYFNPLAYGPTRPVDLWIWAVNFIFTDGKMRALFSLLFGASMLIVIRRAEAAGEDGQRVHFNRMGWLLMFGLIHYYLIWWGDILAHYALIGLVAWFFAEQPGRVLVRWAVGLFAVQFIIFAVLFQGVMALSDAAAAPGASAEAIAGWQRMRDAFGVPTAPALAEELTRLRDGYGGILRHRVVEDGWEPLRMLFYGGAETLGLMLLGMAALKSRFLAGTWGRARYRRAALACYAIGLPPLVALAALAWARDFEPLTLFGATMLGATPFRPVVMLGHAALLLFWLTGSTGAFARRVAAVGRAAFSNYLGTSLVMTTLFYGYGFGLFGTIGRAELYLIVLAAWAAMLLWSKPWLDRFAYGPLEWLWRSLARRELQSQRPSRL